MANEQMHVRSQNEAVANYLFMDLFIVFYWTTHNKVS